MAGRQREKCKRPEGGWGWTDGILRLHVGCHTCLATGSRVYDIATGKPDGGGGWRRWRGGFSSGRPLAAAGGVGLPRLGAQEAPVGGY